LEEKDTKMLLPRTALHALTVLLFTHTACSSFPLLLLLLLLVHPYEHLKTNPKTRENMRVEVWKFFWKSPQITGQKVINRQRGSLLLLPTQNMGSLINLRPNLVLFRLSSPNLILNLIKHINTH